jgi:hypothetical protein
MGIVLGGALIAGVALWVMGTVHPPVAVTANFGEEEEDDGEGES